MIVFQFDHTFEGLLTVVFDAYFRKRFPDVLLAEEAQLPLFADEVYHTVTNVEKAARVWRGLEKKLSQGALAMLTCCWLSEQAEAPMLLFKYIRKTMDSPYSIETNFTDPNILSVTQLSQKVRNERMRAIQFIRFQKTSDGVYFGVLAPLYNVLPLTVEHFGDRFADQRWLIYDTRRHYGYYYDGEEVNEITFSNPTPPYLDTGILADDILDKDEKLFQHLWKSYFNSICIRERLNPRKQQKDMPLRFWKYLTEKR